MAQQPIRENVAYEHDGVAKSAFPEREAATQHLITLSQNYKEELELMQSEYNKKYSDYITYQSSLAENIKLRRMQELTELEKKMQQFMDLAQKDIETQEASLLEPLMDQISKAIQQVGVEQGFTVIYGDRNRFRDAQSSGCQPLREGKIRHQLNYWNPREKDAKEKMKAGAIGIFDSGYGGLTVLSEIRARMPRYDYLYHGDNARAPYGNRSYERVYQFTPKR